MKLNEKHVVKVWVYEVTYVIFHLHVEKMSKSIVFQNIVHFPTFLTYIDVNQLSRKTYAHRDLSYAHVFVHFKVISFNRFHVCIIKLVCN